MADTDYVPGEGDVAITLAGRTEYLKPTLRACLRLSRSGADGPRRLGDQCMALNFETINFVIACGLDLPEEKTQEEVFSTGTISLFGPCIRFLHNVSNGGRPATEGDGKVAGSPRTGG